MRHPEQPDEIAIFAYLGIANYISDGENDMLKLLVVNNKLGFSGTGIRLRTTNGIFINGDGYVSFNLTEY